MGDLLCFDYPKTDMMMKGRDNRKMRKLYEPLFKPIRIGKTEIKNRFVMPPMNSNLADLTHEMTEQTVRYYTERARGQYGLLITEFLCVSEEGLSAPHQPGIYDDRFIPMMKKLTESVHAAGGKIFAQLQHAGRVQAPGLTNLPPIGASAIPLPGSVCPVHEILTSEIPSVKEKFVLAAKRAKEAGFDGVELHGAHGYLLDQFLSKAVNKRTDRYGGSVTNRARIVCELIQEVKAACGTDYPVSVRFNAESAVPGGNTVMDTAAQALLFEEAGADVLNVSYGRAIENYYHIKEIVKIPVIGVGRINDPTLALEALLSGSMDLVATGRQSICDPHFPEKIMEDRIDEILCCTGCMQRCLYGESFEEGFGISCMNNPFSGKEGLWEIKKSEKPKKIAIIGSGPAGLQAAWILGERGNDVTVFEKDDTLGGAYRLACIPPMKQDLGRIVETFVQRGLNRGVTYHTETEADPEMLMAEGFEEIIVAAGAVPVIPRIEGIDGPKVVTAQQVLASEKNYAGKKVLVLGAGLVGAETAEVLCQNNNHVVLVDMLSEVAPLAPYDVKTKLKERLLAHGTEFLLNSKVLQILTDGIRYADSAEDAHEITGFDAIVLAFGSRPNRKLSDMLDQAGMQYHVIGDAGKAGDAKKAIFEATQLAISI